jgi:prepilin-type N-terminal cleavage/methylation domain-containing protein
VTRGCTLIELVVVLAVLAIAAAVVGPAVDRTVDGVRVRAEVAAFAGFLRAAREQAVARQVAYEVVLEPEPRALQLRRPGAEDGPAHARRTFSAALRIEAATPRVTFWPHGMSSGARFAIDAPGPRRYVITVDALTGRVATQPRGS